MLDRCANLFRQFVKGDVIFAITAEKLIEWKELLRKLNVKPAVSKNLLAQFAVKMSWAAGFLFQQRPFARMLRTVLSTPRPKFPAGEPFIASKWSPQFSGLVFLVICMEIKNGKSKHI